MYGYVRPVRDELKVREYERFRGVYCGLCHTLKKRYGPLMRFAVNYDLTFLAMLLAGPEEGHSCSRRCPYHPLRRTDCPATYPAMEAAADYTVILAYWKMLDGARDEGFFGALGARLLAAVIRPSYKKAAAARPAFADTAKKELAALEALEDAKTPVLDAAADPFARLLSAAGEGADSDARARVLRELLYHLGRIVYVLDAADDLREDERTGAYNPLRYRYELQNGALSPEDETALRVVLTHSHNSILAAYALLEKNPYTGILDNIIYFGLPAVTQAVFSGEWRASHKNKRGRNLL